LESSEKQKSKRRAPKNLKKAYVQRVITPNQYPDI